VLVLRTLGFFMVIEDHHEECSLSELVLKKARPSASFGKLHLWRGGGFLPKEGRPSSFRKKLHLGRLPSEIRAYPYSVFPK
jgi:hypothetical protein